MDTNIYKELCAYQRGKLSRTRLFSVAKDNLSFMQRFQLGKKLKVHNGCVNTVCWNNSGQLLLSGSDDRHLIITDPYTDEVKYKVLSGHHANIFSAKFLPNTSEKRIVSCSGDGLITFTDLDNTETRSGYNYNTFDCHFGTVYEVVTVPGDSNSFLSCGEDGTVRWFDLRVKDRCVKNDCTEDVLINCRRAVTSLAVNPLLPWQLSVGCSDGTVVMYDRRKLTTKATGGSGSNRNIQGMVSRFSAPAVEGRNLRITSLTYSDDAEEVLVSYSTDHVYLFNVKEDSRAKKLSSNTEGEAEEGEEGTRPPVKRLRLRGDWSDTGPNALPERERGSSQIGNTAQNIMQRMSDMLTRWLEDAANQQEASDPGNENETDPEGQQASGQGQSDLESGSMTSTDLEAVRELNFGEINLESPVLSPSIRSEKTEPEIAEGDVSKRDAPSSSCDRTSERASENKVIALDMRSESTRDEEPHETSSSVARNDRLGASDMAEIEPGAGQSVTDCVSNIESPVDQKAVSDLKRESVCNQSGTENSCSAAEAEGSSGETVKASNDVASTSNAPQCTSRDDSELKDLHRMVHKLKSQALEPTISLSYSSQGASTSQIKFHFPPKPSTSNGANQNPAPGDVTRYGTGTTEPSSDDSASSARDTRESQPNPSTADLVSGNSEPTAGTTTADKSDSDVIPDDSSRADICSGFEQSRESTSAEKPEKNVKETGDDGQKPETSSAASKSKERRTDEGRAGHSDTEASVRPRGIVGRRVVESDSDSDSERDSPPVARTGAGGSTRSSAMRAIEQNLAARRLQRVFRRRQEQSAQQEEEEMDLPKPAVKQTYRGHRNARTMIKQANFWGRKYVLSGSDCGHVFMWDRQSGRLVMMLEADAHVVNCVQPHPFDPILATSGIDYDIKLWGPFSPDCCFDSERAEQIMERNKVMLEETKDTLTVPASFMLRMLASINRVRAARRGEAESDSDSEQED